MDGALSVVVATRNRARLLPRLFEALEQQREMRFDVVVVNDGSSDETSRVLSGLAARASFPTHLITFETNRGPAAARNAGWKAAAGTLIAFTDDDCVPQSGWLFALASTLQRVDIAQGRTRPDPGQAEHNGPFSRTINVSREDGFYQTCNIAYRRSVLEDLGGFDERYAHAGEDTDLAWRAKKRGAESAFVPAALVHHDIRQSSFLTALRDTGRWRYVVLATREHPGLRSLFGSRIFWRPAHPRAVAAACGAVVALIPAAPRAVRIAGLLSLAEYADFRARRGLLPGGPKRRIAAVPGLLVIDLAEVAVLARASVTYRTLLL